MVVFNVEAYCMMMLHAAKYPHNTVDGILLGRTINKEMIICDAIPLFHFSTYLTPMYEVALRQIEQDYQERGLVIVGYYSSHEFMNEINLEKSNHPVSIKIVEITQSAFHIFIINSNSKINFDNNTIKVAQFIDGNWKMLNMYDIAFGHKSTFDIYSTLLQNHFYKYLTDFDQKLDNFYVDWYNLELKEEISLLK